MADSRSVEALRRRLAHLGAPADEPGRALRLRFGAPALDAAFEDGWPAFAAHEVAAAAPGEEVAAGGFALALLACLLDAAPGRQAVLVQDRAAARENGLVYGPGLLAFGLDPDRLILVETPDETETLRAVHDTLRSGAALGVMAEFGRTCARLNLSATRRFNLAAAENRAAALLVTSAPTPASAAETRWTVASLPGAGAARDLVGPPAFAVELTRNRHGHTGRAALEWECHERRFVPQIPVGLVRPAADGPAGADRPAVETARRRREAG